MTCRFPSCSRAALALFGLDSDSSQQTGTKQKQAIGFRTCRTGSANVLSAPALMSVNQRLRYPLGVPDIVIQRILRHANVSTTASYYIKSPADDVRNAMAKLETDLSVTTTDQTDTNGTLAVLQAAQPSSLQ